MKEKIFLRGGQQVVLVAFDKVKLAPHCPRPACF